MNEQELTQAIDEMTAQECREHFEALMALALSIEEQEHKSGGDEDA